MFAFSASNQAIRRGTPQGRYHLGVVLAAVMLATLGVIMVASSSIAIADNQNAKPFYYLFRHLVFLGLGLGLAILVAADWVDPVAAGVRSRHRHARERRTALDQCRHFRIPVG